MMPNITAEAKARMYVLCVIGLSKAKEETCPAAF
jgi:hypothetical protein